MLRWVFVVVLSMGSAARAAPVDQVMDAAQTAFDRMPDLRIVPVISGACGTNAEVNRQVAYCTSQNVIYLTDAASKTPQAAYLVAHVLGHAVQVQHGIADIALREITQRRAEEATLRGYVAAQVDCVAGFVYARAGLPPAALKDWFGAEPFTGTHWGRDPLRVGPQVQIGIAARDAWFLRGQAASDLNACAAGEFGAELLLRAFKD